MRAGIYYTHYECLGHTSRVFSVVSLLKQRLLKENLFCIQAGKSQPYLASDDSLKTFTLEYPLFERKHFYHPPQFHQEQITQRAKQCLAIIKKQEPDMFFTEYFPLGRAISRFELMPSLMWLFRHKRPIYSVAGYPMLSQEPDFVGESVLKLYQCIFIHAPVVEKEYLADQYEDSVQKKKYISFFERYREKIVFTNYLTPPKLPFMEQEEEILLPKNKINILVLRGGGAYCPHVLAYALQISDLLGEEFFLTMIAGPATTQQEWLLFQSIMEKKEIKNVQLLFQTQQYEALIKQSDLCISSASYHTSILLMKYKKRAVIVPVQGSKNVVLREQPARAQLLKDMLGCVVVDEKDLTIEILKEAIKKGLSINTTLKKIPQEWFQGEQNWLRSFDQAQKIITV